MRSEVGDKVGGIFDPYRNAEKIWRDCASRLELGRDAGVGHLVRDADAGSHAAEAYRDFEELGGLGQLFRGFGGGDGEAEEATRAAGLRGMDFVTVSVPDGRAANRPFPANVTPLSPDHAMC